MSVFGGLSGLGGGDDDGPDYWAVRRMAWNSDGGFREFSDEWAKLDEPVDRETFEWNTGELEPGRYRLMAIKDTKVRRPDDFDVKGWTIEIGDPDASRSDDDPLEQKVDMLLAQQNQGGPSPGNGEVPLMELVNDPADLFVLMGAFNENFVGTFGEQAALKQLGLIGDNELGFDDYKDNPIGAFFFDSYKEPQQLRELGQNLGAGGSAFFDGLMAGYGDPESILADDIEEAEREADAPPDPEEFEPRESRGGSITLEDLGVDKPDPSHVAQALSDTSRDGAAAQNGQDTGEGLVGSGPPADADAVEEPDLGVSGDAGDDGESDETAVAEADLTDADIAAAMEDL
jgi:hypothetical protein